MSDQLLPLRDSQTDRREETRVRGNANDLRVGHLRGPSGVPSHTYTPPSLASLPHSPHSLPVHAVSRRFPFTRSRPGHLPSVPRVSWWCRRMLHCLVFHNRPLEIGTRAPQRRNQYPPPPITHPNFFAPPHSSFLLLFLIPPPRPFFSRSSSAIETRSQPIARRHLRRCVGHCMPCTCIPLAFVRLPPHAPPATKCLLPWS